MTPRRLGQRGESTSAGDRSCRLHARWFSAEDGSNSLGGGLDFDTVMGWCERLAAGHDVTLPTGTSVLVGRRFLGAAKS
ncbi:hypothetical protein FB565_007950 [Actinoplanes lutulentus]|uniref:Uncharacterized protein n=1 Tax=Actinoplanes lutulentus TaxID=1287878 RepID=A0A327Z4U5_9ACTN|nr:hypothetical protein [Actinoplanes lutulentus]MBB2948167.1 hypothetical protein [Actinoplanes lutulentus]RAK31333.1 hypothetical protein B0I29_115139 [Actinoplanes lutulentus]